MVFGRRLRPVYHFDKARVTLSLNDDFMQESDNDVAYIGDFAKSRAVSDPDARPSRLIRCRKQLLPDRIQCRPPAAIKIFGNPAFHLCPCSQTGGKR
jgi:hypothetical protein